MSHFYENSLLNRDERVKKYLERRVIFYSVYIIYNLSFHSVFFFPCRCRDWHNFPKTSSQLIITQRFETVYPMTDLLYFTHPSATSTLNYYSRMESFFFVRAQIIEWMYSRNEERIDLKL